MTQGTKSATVTEVNCAVSETIVFATKTINVFTEFNWAITTLAGNLERFVACETNIEPINEHPSPPIKNPTLAIPTPAQIE